ncbi:ATP-binding protein [Kitasatospora sp. NBC_00070]|uniref:ATP-binding protein n=1 Tax=Kitasatospora sp. NBC_00070 TaxID=2975962 RepID=UPI00324E8AB5
MMASTQAGRQLREWETVWAAAPASVGPARRQVRAVLAERGWPADRLDDLLLICSELVTNAVRHAGDPGGEVRIRLLETGDACRIEVTDTRPDLPLPGLPTVRDEGGRGLLLVRSLAADFGVAGHPGRGKTVWAVVRRNRCRARP